MFPHADTYYAAVGAERKLSLKRAERRALVIEATKRPRATHDATRAAVGQARGLCRAGFARVSLSGAAKFAGTIRRPA